MSGPGKADDKRAQLLLFGGAPAEARQTPPPPAPRAPEPAPPPPRTPVPPPPANEVAPPPPPAAPRIFAVGELVNAARNVLESRFGDVRVEGEISGCKRAPTGHLYFTLKDADAQVDCVMFASKAARLKWKLTDGFQVRCRGQLTIFPGRGKFQLNVVELEPAGAGALALAFEELKKRLAAEGLFAPERKRRLPFLPRRIGVVSSQSGAVIRDIIRVAHRRYPARILLSPTPVQGPDAPPQIVAALEKLWRVPDVDVIIVARGGGSLEDLFCFNDEGLARAIARSPVPVISAVGHETDFTIADFVADVRAPTPSAAAELAVPVLVQLREDLATLSRRATRGLSGELRHLRLGLERLRARVADPRRLIDERRQRVDELAARGAAATRARIAKRRTELRALETRLLCAHPRRRVADQRAALAALDRRLHAAIGPVLATRDQALATLERRLETAGRAILPERRRRLEALAGKLEALSPKRVLERGYALVRDAEGHVVTRAEALDDGDALTLMLHDGEVGATVARRRNDP